MKAESDNYWLRYRLGDSKLSIQQTNIKTISVFEIIKLNSHSPQFTFFAKIDFFKDKNNKRSWEKWTKKQKKRDISPQTEVS